MGEKRVIDWGSIEREFSAGIKTDREIGREFSVSHVSIGKRAVKYGWTKDLSAKIKAKAEAKVSGIKLVEKDEMDSSGFVYIIYIDSGLERIYKIGLAKNFSSRLSTHQCSSPFDIFVSIAYFVESMRLEERTLHAMFDDKRVRGEWFRLDKEDLESIARRSYIGG
jgi:hypothetical protein